jgi:hypothetical protein
MSQQRIEKFKAPSDGGISGAAGRALLHDLDKKFDD